jgi:hypothetical protein
MVRAIKPLTGETWEAFAAAVDRRAGLRTGGRCRSFHAEGGDRA